MCSNPTRAVEVGLGRIQTDCLGAALGQCQRDGAGSASDVQDVIAGLDAGEFQEWVREASAPAAHEVFVCISIVRQERRQGVAHCEPRSLDCAAAGRRRSVRSRPPPDIPAPNGVSGSVRDHIAILGPGSPPCSAVCTSVIQRVIGAREPLGLGHRPHLPE